MLAAALLQTNFSIHFHLLHVQRTPNNAQDTQTYQVKRRNHRVRRSTSNNPAQRTCRKVVRREELDLFLRLHCAEFIRHCFDCQAIQVLKLAFLSRARLLLPERWSKKNKGGIERQLRKRSEDFLKVTRGSEALLILTRAVARGNPVS
jgi:hypothetical protein